MHTPGRGPRPNLLGLPQAIIYAQQHGDLGSGTRESLADPRPSWPLPYLEFNGVTVPLTTGGSEAIPISCPRPPGFPPATLKCSSCIRTSYAFRGYYGNGLGVSWALGSAANRFDSGYRRITATISSALLNAGIAGTRW